MNTKATKPPFTGLFDPVEAELQARVSKASDDAITKINAAVDAAAERIEASLQFTTRIDIELITRVYASEIEYYADYGDGDLEPKSIIVSNAIQMADAIADANPQFDRDAFLIACGIND